METKKITLRSQTVKCPHCGEYYSVTYKYCPFCDAGRQEEERRLAEKKKKKQAFFSNLFGGGHEEEKPAKSAKRPAKAKEDASAEPKKQPEETVLPEDLGEGPDLLAATPRPRPEVALRNERNPRAFDAEGVEIPLEEIKPKAHRERSGQPAHGTKTAHSGKNGKRKKPALEPEQPELTTPHRRRKKTSEMTEAEKAVDRAEREARAAARKRERDRKAQEAALAAEASKQSAEAKEAEAQSAQAEVPVQTEPVGTEATAPEAAQPAAPQETAQPAAPLIGEMPDEMPLVGSGPVFDQETVPESFGFEETIVSTDPAILNEPTIPAAPAAEPVPEAPATPVEPAAPAAPVVTESPEEIAARQQWAALQEMEQLPEPDPVEAPEIPNIPEAPAPEVQVGDTIVQPAAPAQSQEAPAPAAEPAQEKPVETEEDLDALLNEIRDLLADSPVPKLKPEELVQPEVPAEPDPEVQLSEEPARQPETLTEEEENAAFAQPEVAPVQPEPEVETAPEAPVLEEPAAPAEEVPVVEEPTIAMGKLDLSDPLSAPVDEALYDDQPTQVIPTQEIVEELEAKADAEVEEDELDHELPSAVLPPRRTVAPQETKPHESKRRAKADKPAKPEKPAKTEKPAKAEKAEKPKKSKKKGSATLPLIIVSLVIIIAAAVIVFHKVLPTLQNGIFAGQSAAAESLTLDQTEVSLAEAGTAVTLVPTFSPDGSTGTVTWTSSDEKIAAVDEAGTVTAVAPGNVTITATLENGATAECKVSCTWTAEGGDNQTPANEGGGEGAEQPQEAAKPALSNNDITLSSEGATQQLTVENAGGDVTWTSSDDTIAKVSADGTVTAVAPGRATVSAKIGEQTLNCAVRCVW